MRCPECNSLNSDTAAACTTCGLLLTRLAPPKRRREDLGHERRRAADQTVGCPFCKGEIAPEAVRCRHCSEYVNAEYRHEMTLRRRSRINYASWVAYVFGLITFLIFRPAGVIAIGAGLLLSIAYYAIPVERPAQPVTRSRWSRLKLWARTQLAFERVAVPIPLPHLSRRRLVFVGSPLLVAFLGFLVNFFLLQQPMNEVVRQNRALSGVRVSTHYKYWVVPGVIVYDLKGVEGPQSRLDVHTVLLEYARRMKDRSISRVDLMFQGTRKFSIPGKTFRRLASEYEKQNYAWVLFDFPRLVSGRDEGGDREALLEFHNRWYAGELEDRKVTGPLFREEVPHARAPRAAPARR